MESSSSEMAMCRTTTFSGPPSASWICCRALSVWDSFGGGVGFGGVTGGAVGGATAMTGSGLGSAAGSGAVSGVVSDEGEGDTA